MLLSVEDDFFPSPRVHVMKNFSCHVCATHAHASEKCLGQVSCQARPEHVFCSCHADMICGIDVERCVAQYVFRYGCPVCANVCPCGPCSRARGEVGYELSNMRVSALQGAPKRHCVAQGDEQAKLCFVNAQRVPIEEFTDELFEQVVLKDRLPLIVTGMDRKMNRKLWDLLEKVKGKDFSESHVKQVGASMVLRVQGVNPLDHDDYVVLDEMSGCTPAYFLQQVLWGGRHGSFLPPYRPSSTSRCVLYCKDWSFNKLEPLWEKDLLRILPSRLVPGNPCDLLRGLRGDQRVEVLMAYLGGEGTRTPLHLDKCGSVAFNLAVWSEEPASSFKQWWLVHPSDTPALEVALKRKFGPEATLVDDSHWVDFLQLPNTGFQRPVTVVEQRVGDMVLVPPNSPHCVMNRGGVTFAVAANVIDCLVLSEVLETEAKNRSLQSSSVYRIKVAVWGLMMLQTKEGRVDPALVHAAQSIYEEEKTTVEKAEKVLQKASTGQLGHAKQYMGTVTCDRCKGDIFNAYTVKYRGRVSYCLDEACYLRDNSELDKFHLVAPKSMDQLKDQLEAAIKKVPEVKCDL